MENTIYSGDTIEVDMTVYEHRAVLLGDIVVFHHGDNTIMKRVIGLPGNLIEGREGKLFRNGQPLVEPYVHFTPDHPLDVETFAPVKVAAGEIFVVGDSRDESLDSRSAEFGPVTLADVVGKVVRVAQSKHPAQSGRAF